MELLFKDITGYHLVSLLLPSQFWCISSWTVIYFTVSVNLYCKNRWNLETLNHSSFFFFLRLKPYMHQEQNRMNDGGRKLCVCVPERVNKASFIVYFCLYLGFGSKNSEKLFLAGLHAWLFMEFIQLWNDFHAIKISHNVWSIVYKPGV